MTMELLADQRIWEAISCLKDQLENHPTRDGNSIGYRIEQAITLLKEAHELTIKEPV